MEDVEPPEISSFDPEWYLAAYPDVAEQRVDPWRHYCRHGRFENRLPRRNRALEFEHALWRGASTLMLGRLHELVADADATDEEQVAGRLALARWFRWQEDWPSVCRVLAPHEVLISGKRLSTPNIALLMVETCCFTLMKRATHPTVNDHHTGEHGFWAQGLDDQYLADLLTQALSYLDHEYPAAMDTALAHANAGLINKAGLFNEPHRLTRLNHLLAKKGLATLTQGSSDQQLTLDNLSTVKASGNLARIKQGATQTPLPLVSVIVPVYNAEATLGTALASLFAQQRVRIEVLVVDDASTDASTDIVQRYSERCPRHVTLRLLQHTINQGAYAARNTGAAKASGEWITVHDSDDWSHPEKLYLQVEALQANSTLKASLSYWVRATPELLFHRWRLDEYGWLYPNISSLMMSIEIIETLGFWDEVKVNADTEYRERIVSAYGVDSIGQVMPDTPLSFGRSQSESLSQQTASHLISQFSGMRYHYMSAARRWHGQADTLEALYLPIRAVKRPFFAPREMCRDQMPVLTTAEDRLRDSSIFDSGWYLQRYADLQAAMIEPFEHFCLVGSKENRDPGPDFSTSGYRRDHEDELVQTGLEPWEHYLIHTAAEAKNTNGLSVSPLPVWSGKRNFPGQPSVMLCAHQLGDTLFGAERSLLDVLDAMGALEWNVVILLPSAGNAEYEALLREKSKAVAVVPYGWWANYKEPVDATVEHISKLIKRFAIEAVHANTLVLNEPLCAARQAKIPAIVHVRELPNNDSALCELLGATPKTVIMRTHRCADIILANSRAVADAFSITPSSFDAKPIHIVPNTIDMPPLQELKPRETDGVFKVGMLSSNLPKKGLNDIEQVATALKVSAPSVQFYIFGPHTDAIERLLARQGEDKAFANLHYAGYVESARQALVEVDAVVNLSHFQESFGRTVLEAMAAARPVVTYEWGALPELIKDGETGYLVPFASPAAVAERLAQLSQSPALCRQMGQAARQYADMSFGADKLKSALKRAYLERNVFKSLL